MGGTLEILGHIGIISCMECQQRHGNRPEHSTQPFSGYLNLGMTMNDFESESSLANWRMEGSICHCFTRLLLCSFAKVVK